MRVTILSDGCSWTDNGQTHTASKGDHVDIPDAQAARLIELEGAKKATGRPPAAGDTEAEEKARLKAEADAAKQAAKDAADKAKADAAQAKAEADAAKQGTPPAP